MKPLLSIVAVLVLAFTLPSTTLARPFGGATIEAHFCHDRTIYAPIGPPVGGIFIWNKDTDWRMFSPPIHVGQWILGLSGVPRICLYTVAPIDIRGGESIILMGSSQ